LARMLNRVLSIRFQRKRLIARTLVSCPETRRHQQQWLLTYKMEYVFISRRKMKAGFVQKGVLARKLIVRLSNFFTGSNGLTLQRRREALSERVEFRKCRPKLFRSQASIQYHTQNGLGGTGISHSLMSKKEVGRNGIFGQGLRFSQ